MVLKGNDKENKALQLLLAKAEEQGYVTLDDIMAVFPTGIITLG